jgi:GPH family glycoside/pentoside/hexuronide:cation symporter
MAAQEQSIEQGSGIVTERLKIREKAAYGLGDVASNVVWSSVGSFATFYYTNSAGMAAAAIGTMFLISRIFDGLSDILMGLIIDRTRSKYGKARPWLLWMAVPFGIAAVLLYSVPAGWGPGAKLIYAYITYNLLSTIVYTAINLSYGTMTALITDDSRDRTHLNIFRMIGAVIGGTTVSMIVMPMVNGFGGNGGAWQKTFAILGGIAVVLFVLCFAGTKERVGASTKKEDVPPVKIAFKALLKNKYWYIVTLNSVVLAVGTALGGVNVYFAKYWLGDEELVGLLSIAFALPLFIALVFMTPLSVKFGKRNICMAGTVVGIAGMILQAVNPASLVVTLLGFVLRGIGLSANAAVGFVMVADVIDYGEWKTGIRSDGLVYSASSFGQKVGTGLGAASLGWALSAGGFNAANAVQDKPAMTAILSILVYLPMVVSVISFILLWFYKLDKELPGILAELKTKHGSLNTKGAVQ